MSNDNIINVNFGGNPPQRSPGSPNVAPSPAPFPMLWVIPPDLINGVYSETLVSCISHLGNIHVWQLDGGAVAFSLPDILVKRGRPLDYDAFLKRIRPLFQIVDSCAIANRDATDLEIPDTKYWVRMSLKSGEHDKQSCRYFKSHLTESSPFAFRAYSSFELGETDLENVKKYLTDWLLAAGKRSVCGETLHVGNTEVKGHTMPATGRSYPESGFEVRCSDYSPCTWPWIDFYLRMRRELPVKKRLSIHFFNP
jgi:hypothetical protein